MLSAVWLLAAIELNGALISRGAQAAIHDQHCLIEAKAMAPAITPQVLAEKQRGDHVVLDAGQCEYDSAENILRVRLDQRQLAQKTLQLSAAPGTLGVALLHDENALSGQPEFSAQPKAASIPSAAIDFFAGSSFKAIGVTLARGPLLFQALRQSALPATTDQSTKLRQRYQRATVDYLFKSGAQIRAGDLRSERGVDQQLSEYRGVLVTNRTAPLRGDGKAEASLTVTSPSRVQFFDQSGAAVYASEILAPGNYQVQGFGASSVPGFLQARLIDRNGVTQIVDLAWTADRRLLSKGQIEWESFYGHLRNNDQVLAKRAVLSARIRYGLTTAVTAGAYAEVHQTRKRWSAEISSRTIPNLLLTGAIGQACGQSKCNATWLMEMRSSLHRKASLIASLSDSQDPIEPTQQVRSGQISLSGVLHPRLTGSISHAYQRLLHLPDPLGPPIPLPDRNSSQHVTSLSGAFRVSPRTSVLFQARRLQSRTQKNWSGFLGISFYFSAQRTSISSYANYRSTEGLENASHSGTVQANYSSPGLYGPQIYLSHQADSAPRTDAFMRYASSIGEGSIKVDSVTNKANWSLSSRLWITGQTITLAPAGEENLVIQEIGLPNVRMRHHANESQTTNQQGQLLFKKAPIWAQTTYTIDPKSIPFGYNLAAFGVKIPMAANRAYLVDFRSLWAQAKTWKIDNIDSMDLPANPQAVDQAGQIVFMSSEGYLDLQSDASLPIELKNQQGQTLTCKKSPEKPGIPNAIKTEILLTCESVTIL